MAAVMPLVPLTRQADGSAASAAPQPGHAAFRGGNGGHSSHAHAQVQRAALQVSSPHDAAEREASDVARRVVQMPGPAVHRVTGTATTVSAAAQRIVARSATIPATTPANNPATAHVAGDTAARIQASRGGGQGLSVPLRRFMEPRFGADFSKVRIHTDANAQQLSRRLSARAFTVGGDIFFGPGQYQPDTAEGRELIAHELTHTLQQGVATAAPTTIHRASLAESVTPQPSGLVQRLGLSDILDGLADLAANVPGYTLLTLVIGRNPINMRTVERNTVNLLRAFIGLIPGGELLFQVLQRQGIALRIATWVDAQTTALGLNFQTVRDAFTRFTDSLSWTDIFSPGDVWRRAQAIFTPLIARVTGFVGGLITQAITWLKETFMAPLSDFCRQIPGYGLVTVLLGRDPFTNAPVPRTAMTVVRAFAEFIPGGTEKVDQLVQSGALDRAYAWFQQETSARNLTWARVTGTFSGAWASLQLSDVMHPIDTITRIVGLFRPLMSDLVGFAGAALMKLLELIYEAAMGAGGRRILAILMRARATFVTIIQNPVGFLRNLMGAIGQGIRQFMGNILTHLRDGVIRWLTGPVAAAGVQMPERWDLRGIIWFVLQILGLTWDRVRGKLVRLIGEPAMGMLERGFQLIQDIRERGLVQALRDRVTEFFGNLRESALGAIRGFIQQRLVQAGIQQLLSLLSPVGAIVQAIIKTYTTIQFFIQKINQILDLVESIVNSIAAIASGAIGAAANLVERTMARTIPVILDFLARFIGLGDVGAQVQTTIRNLQGAVDRMLDRAVEWIRNQARNLASRALGGDPTRPPAERVRLAVAEGKQALQRFGGQRVGALVLRPLLAAIRVRHGLTQLDVVARGETWAVRGVINPTFEDGTNILVIPEGNANEWPTGSAQDPIPIKWFKSRDSLYPTLKLRSGSDRTPRQGIRLPAIDRTEERLLQVADANFMAVGDKIRRQPRGSESVKAQVRNHIEKLRALSPSDPQHISFTGQNDYAIDHVRDLTWRGNDDLANLWPLATAKNSAINASHNQRVRVREGNTIRTNAVSTFPDRYFIIKKITTSVPSSSSDHGSTNDHPINSGEGDIPKRST